MRLLVDANLSPRLVAELRRRGYEAVHVQELGLGGADDRSIFTRAEVDNYVVVTSDLDFGGLAAAYAGSPVGIALLRLRSSRVDVAARRLVVALSVAADALTAGAVVVVEPARLRVWRSANP